MKSVYISACLLVYLLEHVACNWISYPIFNEDNEEPTLFDENVFAADTTKGVIIVTRTLPTEHTLDIDSGVDTLYDNQPGFSSANDKPQMIDIEKLNEIIDKLLSEMKAQQKQITELETLNRHLQDKIDLMEQQIKTNNVIFLNVQEDDEETYKTTTQKVLQIINRMMKVSVNSVDISVALRAQSNVTQYRPIVVRFTNYATKMKVLGARGRLVGSEVMVMGDYSEGVARIRSQLLPYMQLAQKEGHRAFLLYDKLVVDGVKRSLEELQSEEIIQTRTQESSEQEDPKDQVEEVEVDPQFQDHEFDE